MTAVLVPCALCGGAHFRELFPVRDWVLGAGTGPFAVARCQGCGLVMCNPRPPEAAMGAYYTAAFYRTDHTRASLLAERAAQLEAKWQRVKALPPGRLLDIGCQKGEFPYFMQQRGWQVRGAEFQPTMPNLFGIPMDYGDVTRLPYRDGEFDLVTLWAVLEHVYRPQEVLRTVARILAPGGHCVLLVTNFMSLQGRWMGQDDYPRHLTLFTRHTLSAMLRACGLRPTGFDYRNDIFGGSIRGALNFAVKCAAGEPWAEVAAQSRMPGRWSEFSSRLRGRPSRAMMAIDSLDQRLAPWLDRVLEHTPFGFIMTVHAQKL